jgi:hypothetical protein
VDFGSEGALCGIVDGILEIKKNTVDGAYAHNCALDGKLTFEPAGGKVDSDWRVYPLCATEV